MAIKLNMNKAYDTISWHALIKVMRKFGFSERWIVLIWRNLSSCWYSILINGRSSGFSLLIGGLDKEIRCHNPSSSLQQKL